MSDRKDSHKQPKQVSQPNGMNRMSDRKRFPHSEGCVLSQQNKSGSYKKKRQTGFPDKGKTLPHVFFL
ncbi:hypothetical protein JCM10003_1411 [Bacteroides pyogenes JCM 10003]|nr:hypothetical protein JCM10003_1411 [Bacteroides pyogenes JCM 10003]